MTEPSINLTEALQQAGDLVLLVHNDGDGDKTKIGHALALVYGDWWQQAVDAVPRPADTSDLVDTVASAAQRIIASQAAALSVVLVNLADAQGIALDHAVRRLINPNEEN